MVSLPLIHSLEQQRGNNEKDNHKNTGIRRGPRLRRSLGDCVMALECGIIRAICRAEELMADWNLAANHGEVFKIRGLDER